MENNSQHPFLQIEDAIKEEVTNKVCDWLKYNLENYYFLDEAYEQVISVKNVVADLKKYLSE